MNDRGVSITISYIMNLTLAMILITGLLTTTGNIVENRQQEAIRTELGVVGQRIAANLMTADRMVTAGGDDVRVTTNVPGEVAGSEYSITINAAGTRPYAQLESVDPEVRVRVYFTNETAVERTTVDGGDLTIELVDGELEVNA